jgi:tRNA threonylcarbamoyladenosine biosynthesis protein TsaE
MTDKQIISNSPDETFALGAQIGKKLRGREVILLFGGLGAGKTLLTKGILSSLDYDVDEVTSPSFALVNLYKAPRFNVYHIDLWRSDGGDAAFSVGLQEILEDEKGIVIIEWAEHLSAYGFDGTVYKVHLSGDGEEPRRIGIKRLEQTAGSAV